MENEKKITVKTKVNGFIRDVIDKIDDLSDEEAEKIVWNKGLDLLEGVIELTPTKIDDIILKPIIAILRARFRL